MKELEQYRAAMARLPKECREAEVQAERQKKLSAELVGGVPGAMSLSEQTELFVRASGEKTGMVYTQKLDEEPLRVIRQALINSESGQSGEPEPMCTPQIWERLGKEQTKEEESPSEASVKELTEFGRTLSAAIQKKCAGDDRVRVVLGQTILTMGLVNSLGMDTAASVSRYTAEVMTDSGYAGYLSALSLEELSADSFIGEMEQWKKTRLPVIPSEPGTYRAVLSSGVVNNILITAWQMFTGRRALSGTTPFSGREGQRIFSPCVTIRDYKGGRDSKNPVTCGFSWEIDCEGVPSQDLTLVENGVLKGWMHNLSSAKQAGVPPTGNAGRKTLLSGNIHTDMLITPKNFTMESGQASLDELIADCGDGIYIFENYDQFHALNVASGDFAFPCKGIRICGGKLTGVMEGLTMNGNVCSLFSRIEKLGRDRRVNPLAMYDSYEVSGPAMLVSGLRISG